MTARVESEIGPITCLVNNAGVSTVPCLFKNGGIEVSNEEKSLKIHHHNVTEVEESCECEHHGNTECDLCHLSSDGVKKVWSCGQHFICLCELVWFGCDDCNYVHFYRASLLLRTMWCIQLPSILLRDFRRD